MTIVQKFEVAGTGYNVNTLKVTSNIGDFNSASTFDAVVKNPNNKYDDVLTIGKEVIIYADKDTDPPTTKIFTGLIESAIRKGVEQDSILTIKGRDYSKLLMDVIVEPEIYTDQEVSVTVKDLMTKYISDLTVVNVAVTTVTLERISFNNISVYDAIKKLAEKANFYFYVDTDKDLHFSEKESNPSGLTLDNTNVINSTFSETSREIYNNVWVYGDRILSGWTNSFTGDGVGSVFTLDYKPHNTKNFVDDVLQKGGIFEMMALAPTPGIHYLVNYDEQQIIYVETDTENNIPANGADILINYDRSTPIIKYGVNRESERIYGKKDKVIVDLNIKDPREAKQIVLQTLEEYSSSRIQGTVNIKGIVSTIAGNTIKINLPESSINNQTYQILSVSYNFNSTTIQNEKVVSITVSKKLLDLTDTLKDMLIQLKQLQAQNQTSDDVISRLETDQIDQKFRVKEWKVIKSEVENSFILGGAVNGILGNPQVAANGFQLELGSSSFTSVIVTSGTEASGGLLWPTAWGTWGLAQEYN